MSTGPGGTAGSAVELLPELEIDYPARQRRWTVLIRFLLAIPQLIVVNVLFLAAYVVVIIGWFAALVLGRLPTWAGEFLYGTLAWYTRVSAYLYLLVDAYPPFAFEAPGYPVRLEVTPAPLNRLAVLFRIILVIPAYIVLIVILYGWSVALFVIWLVVLIAGRTPVALFEASAAMLRYATRFSAYMLLLTPAYPKGLFGDAAPLGGATDPHAVAGSAAVPSTRPLILSRAGRNLLVLFIVLGALVAIGVGVNNGIQASREIPTQRVYIQ